MERPPNKSIKEFSKENSAEERVALAKAIRSKRNDFFTRKKGAEKQRDILLHEQGEVAGELQSLNALSEQLGELSTFGVDILEDYFHMRAIESDLSENAVRDIEALPETGTITASLEFAEASKMAEDFYKAQEQKWTATEFSNEDIVEHFSEENLARCSLEEYILLLKRFPNEMVTHVTRQGVRDHSGHWYHTGGMSQYSDSFKKMAADGRMRSPLGVSILEAGKREAVRKYFDFDSFKTKDEALRTLDNFIVPNPDGGTYADRAAIHFASEEVADNFYGSERYNEIFIAYPSAMIASQYHFNGKLTEGRRGSEWNDTWVWANEEKGIDLNAGVVFLPGDTMVDKETGSRYELNEQGEPTPNQVDIDAILLLADSPAFEKLDNEIRLAYESASRGRYEDTQRRLSESLKPIRVELGVAGITDPLVQNVVLGTLNNGILSHIQSYRGPYGNREESARATLTALIKRELNQAGVLFIESQNSQPAKDYWEAYFEKQGKRPSKIVYYEGGNPTAAFYRWRNKHGLTKRSSSEDFGFPERSVSRMSEPAQTGVDRFRSIAEEIIEERFAA